MATLKDKVRGGEILYVTPRTTVRDVAQLLAKNGIGAVPVLHGSRLVGIFSERDLLTRVIAVGLNLETTHVEDVMTRRLITAGPGDSLDLCLQKMQSAGCRHLPVLAGKILIGFLSIKDLLMFELRHRSTEIKQLKLRMWTESIPSSTDESTWECGACRHWVRASDPPAQCPECKAPQVQFRLAAAHLRDCWQMSTGGRSGFLP